MGYIHIYIQSDMLQGKSTGIQPGISGISGISGIPGMSFSQFPSQFPYGMYYTKSLYTDFSEFCCPVFPVFLGIRYAVAYWGAPVARTALMPSAAPLPKLARPARFTGTSKRDLLTQQKRPTNTAKETY